MNLVNVLNRANNVRVTLSCHYRVDTDFPIPTIEGDKTFVKCLTKTPDSLTFDLDAENFDLPEARVQFTGAFVGTDGDGNPLVQWTVNQQFDPAITYSTILGDIHFDAVQGGLLTVLKANDPIETGAGCDGINRTFVCIFEDAGDQNSIVVKGDNGTTVTLSDIRIVANVGLTVSINFQITAHHNHFDDCGDYFDLAGEEVNFRAAAAFSQSVSNLGYMWSVTGAAPAGPNNLSQFKILLPAADGTAQISVEIVDNDTGISDFFIYKLRFYSPDWSRFIYLGCELRKLMRQRIFRRIPFDPGDPAIFIDPADRPYSREDLSHILSVTKALQSSIENILSRKLDQGPNVREI